MTTFSTRGWLVLILGIGVFFRLLNLGVESLWEDEIGSLLMARKPALDILFKPLEEIHPPFYFVFLKGCTKVFGESEFGLRLPSAILGVLSLLLVFLIGKTLFNEQTALLAAFLTAVSAFHIRYSQEARNYSLFVFLSLLSFWFFLRIWKSPGKVSTFGYVICNICLLYTSSVGFFILLGQNIFFFSLLYSEKEQASSLSVKNWIFAQVFICLGFLPWVPRYLGQMAYLKKGWWLGIPNVESIWSTFLEFGGGLSSCHGSGDYSFDAPIVFTCAAICLCILSPFSFEISSDEKANSPSKDAPDGAKTVDPGPISDTFAARGGAGELFEDEASMACAPFFDGLDRLSWITRLYRIREWFFTVLWLATGLLVPFFISFIGPPVFMAKSVITASIPWYLLICRGLDAIVTPACRRGAIFLLILLSALNLGQYFGKNLKDQWREAAAYVKTQAGTKDTIIVSSARCKNSFDYYFQPGIQEVIPFPTTKSTIDAESVRELFPKILSRQEVWLLLSYHTFGDSNIVIKEMMKHFTLLGGREVFGVQIYRFKRNP